MPTALLNLADPVNRQHPHAQELKAWWRVVPGLDGGNKLYSLINDNPLALTAAPTWKGSSRPGGDGHLDFNGSSQFGTSTHIVPLGANFSVSAWVKPTVDPQSGFNRIAESQYATGFVLAAQDVGVVYMWYLAGTSINGGAVTALTWTHLCGTYDGTTGTLYQNGLSVNSSAATVGATTLAISVGQYYGGGLYWNGSIDDVRIINRCLSAAEVREQRWQSMMGDPGLLNRIDSRSWLPIGLAVAPAGGSNLVGPSSLVGPSALVGPSSLVS